MKYKICIVGLGLMGGSLAYALRGFRGARIAGADVRAEACQKAEQGGAVDEAHSDAAKAIEDADLIIFCVYARYIPALVKDIGDIVKPGAIITDICGVKSGLYRKLEGILPQQADYVGIHPMAGKERGGFENADPIIFRDSGFIICPLPSTKPQSVSLMQELAGYIGAKRISVSPPAEHDEIIAYTSGLTHIAAAGLCIDYHEAMTSAFTGGAFRDCTRIADINAAAWTELLMDNRPNTLDRLERYIESLQEIRRCLADNDAGGLRELLELAGKNKRERLGR